MQDRKQFYQERISELNLVTSQLNQKAARIVRLRVLVAAIAALSIYLSLALNLYFLWATLLLAVTFFRLVQRHVKNSEEQSLVATMTALSRDELLLLEGNHSVFDTGFADVTPGHIYATDLDIFGKGSLFQSVNRSVTHDGRSRVVGMLLHPLADLELIGRQKQAVDDASVLVAWRQKFFAIGNRSGEKAGDMNDVAQWLGQKDFFDTRRFWIWIAAAASLVSTSFIAWMFVVAKFYLGLLIVLLVVNTALFQFFNREGRIYFSKFGSRTALFRKFSEMVNLVIRQEFKSALGNELKGRMTDAGAAFMNLSRLHNLAEQRANGLVSFVMNGLFLFDVWTIYRIEKWRSEHKAHAIDWIKALGYVDLINSCANFKFNHPSFADADVMESPPFVRSEGLGHPLIAPELAVLNDYQVGNGAKAHIITGSNMAGKSTFIRAVGLNVVLALNGLPVCATRFSCSIMEIASCIRITDSLEDHASYFKAELDRLQTVVGLLKTGQPYLVLLDEILRGTNSDDKRRGTLSFYRKLGDYNCICLLATHDLAIGQLEAERPDRFANFCFESRLEGTDLVFDYKLKKGVSSSTNATFLMRKLNLID